MRFWYRVVLHRGYRYRTVRYYYGYRGFATVPLVWRLYPLKPKFSAVLYRAPLTTRLTATVTYTPTVKILRATPKQR